MQESLNTMSSRLPAWLSLGSKGSLRSHLVRGTLGAFALNSCGLVFQLVTGVLLARLLGAAGYGTYAYAMALIGLMTVPTVIGLPHLIVRNMAVYQAKNEFSLMRGLLVRGNQAVFLVSLLIAGAAAAISLAFAERFDPSRLHTFLIALVLLPFLALMNVRMAALRGLRHVVLGIMPDTLIRPALFVFTLVVGIFILPSRLSPQWAMIFQVSVTAIAFLIGAFLLMRLLPVDTKTAVSDYDTGTWLKSALPFMFLGAMQHINKQTDIVMLGLFRSVEEVGIYRAVVQGVILVGFVLTVVNTVLAPTIAELYARADRERLQRVVTLSARAILAGTLPVALVLIFGGEWLLGMFFGEEFRVGGTALSILCLGQLISVGMGPVGVILNMTGHERDAARGVAVAPVLNIVLNALLIPKFGMEGAAAASGLSLVSWNLLMFYWVCKRTGIVSTAFRVRSE
jgi:O-antigen/teichoic acid export membrane protein